VHGLPVMADFALDSEALFKQMGSTAMMMGELALLESEVSPVLDGLMREGISVMAIHFYMHTFARGDALVPPAPPLTAPTAPPRSPGPAGRPRE